MNTLMHHFDTVVVEDYRCHGLTLDTELVFLEKRPNHFVYATHMSRGYLVSFFGNFQI